MVGSRAGLGKHVGILELYQHRSVFEIVDRPRRPVLATTEHRPDRPSFDFSVEVAFEDDDGRTP